MTKRAKVDRKMPEPVAINIPIERHGGYLEHTNLDAEMKKLTVHRNFWVKFTGGRKIQPFALVVPAGTKTPVWANLITGTVHDRETGLNKTETLKIQFRAAL